MPDLGGQFEMVATITVLTGVLKMYVIDFLPLKWGQKDKTTMTLCFLAAFIVIYLNHPGLPWQSYVQATLMYALAASGAHANLKGSSIKIKNKLSRRP